MSLQLDDKYYYVVTDSEREQLITGLQEVEDWLYGDGKDETKCVYAAMLEELKQVKTETRYVMFAFFASYFTRRFVN